jgi:CheY-like chemotaxis protein
MEQTEDNTKKDASVPRGAGRKVLIVDDDEFLLNMYAMKFKKEGFDVNTATGSLMALGKLREGYVPDLMLLDVIMPTMDGLELLESIRNEKLVPNAVSIFLTNQSQQVDIERAKKLGVNGYIIKASTIPSEVLTETLKILDANKPA